MRVTALLVCHDGARWLPAVLRGLAALTTSPETTVVVDTGSNDGSPELARAALGVEPLVLPASTSFPAAVRAGLASLPPVGSPDEGPLEQGSPVADQDWIWLLHDDSNPAPDCLDWLVRAAGEVGPEVAVIGPKLREWPSLKGLLEVGVTVSGTGRRETWLEPGEYDQGQHDDPSEVLAVNTAGMLVRRSVLERVGLDENLPLFGNDLDFGWRLARQGYGVVVEPAAVMFHAEAAHRRQRTGELAERPRAREREAAGYTLLANAPAATLPFRILRLLVGGLLRSLGLLLVRAPREAGEELAGTAAVLARPGRLRRARRARRGAPVSHRTMRHLLAPAWLPYRHGLDFVTESATAVAGVAADAARERAQGRSLSRRIFGSPSVWGLLALFVLSFPAAREIRAAVPSGGALLPSPDGVGHWWALWADRWHWIGPGSDAAAASYVLPLAVLGTLLLGQAGVVTWLLVVLVAPLSMLGAVRFLGRVTTGAWAKAWGGLAYGLLPVLAGASAQGRLGSLAAMVVLPWVATAALGLGSQDASRRARASWRTALGSAILVMFVPSVWLVLLLLALLAVLTPWVAGRRWSLRLVLPIVLVPIAWALPWLWGTWQAPGLWLLEAGKAGAVPLDPDYRDLLFGRGPGPGSAPLWLGAGIPLAALVAWIRPEPRARVLVAWIVAAVAAVVVAGLSLIEVRLPGVPAALGADLGFPVLLMQAAFVSAAAIAADGAIRAASSSSFGWRQPVAAVALLGAIAGPGLGALWWVGRAHDTPVAAQPESILPRYMEDLAQADERGGVLVLRGGRARPVTYQLLRRGQWRVGDDSVAAATEPDRAVTDAVAALVSGDDDVFAPAMAERGITYVFAPAPASPAVSGALDAASGVSGASAPVRGSRAWQVDGPQTLDAVRRTGGWVHPTALAAQVLAVIAVVVLALPERRRRR